MYNLGGKFTIYLYNLGGKNYQFLYSLGGKLGKLHQY